MLMLEMHNVWSSAQDSSPAILALVRWAGVIAGRREVVDATRYQMDNAGVASKK